jgi:hypothetical protein
VLARERDARLAFFLPVARSEAPLLGQRVDDDEAEVVARARVLRARVAEPDDEEQLVDGGSAL